MPVLSRVALLLVCGSPPKAACAACPRLNGLFAHSTHARLSIFCMPARAWPPERRLLPASGQHVAGVGWGFGSGG
eukprot:6027021-Pleurochrysis_carterae.AAC.8